ncbi:hypothetical protein [Micromonospora profundi]|uniref:Uncharacterized protein n=1 Tax=Micromonospora profundi TaxID=1420889 RepID=A0AAJ6HP82_9ACTN|nr:hypothetical protein [Micromonospora profundi]NJC12386.1 hypothetical protein [Micromonospora profundi]WLS44241.1 hypothetical protein Q3V37_22965 [Micromonospora profundi]
MARSTGSGPWPALPDEMAWPGQPAATTGRAAGPGHGHRDDGWASRTSDPWPTLPDDRSLWAVPGEALDATRVDRLDREQASD